MTDTHTEAPPIRAEKLFKSFRIGSRHRSVLRGVDLELRRGEFVAVMGPSGSGKSTLLHVLAGLTGFDGGTVRVDGRDLAGMNDAERTKLRRRRVGVVFQAFNLIAALDARDNIALPVLADGRDVDPGRLDHLLGRLGIEGLADRRPGTMSGGEQQRVAIARALLPQPAAILADEPTGSLDSVAGQDFCKLVRELVVEENRAVLVVTHEPAVAAWADRVLVLKDGSLVGEIRPGPDRSAHDLAARYQDKLDAAVPAMATEDGA